MCVPMVKYEMLGLAAKYGLSDVRESLSVIRDSVWSCFVKKFSRSFFVLYYVLVLVIFTARCYASAVLAMDLCPCLSVCVCVCLSQAGVLLKRQNVGSHKQHHIHDFVIDPLKSISVLLT